MDLAVLNGLNGSSALSAYRQTTFGLLVLANSWLGLNLPQIQTLIFLKLAVAGHLALLVARTRRPFLTKSYPAPVLLWAAIGTKVLVTLFVADGFGLIALISWAAIGLVWASCPAWVFIEDWAKLYVYHRMELAAQRLRR